MVRVFHHWFSPRKAALFVAEEGALILALGQAWMASLAFAAALYLGDLYDLRAASRDRVDGRRLLRALGGAALVLAAIHWLAPAAGPAWALPGMMGGGLVAPGAPGGNLLGVAAVGALAIVAVRLVLPVVMGSPAGILVLGVGPRAWKLARDIEGDGDGQYRIRGFVPLGDADAAVGVPASLRLSGGVEALARRLHVEVVVVAVEDRRAHLPVPELLACRIGGIPVVEDVDFVEAVLQRIPLSLVRPSSLIFEDGFRVGTPTRALKRALDLLISAAILVLTAPVVLAAAAAIAVSDGRPILYAQERVGRGGRGCRIWKLRTMRRDAESKGAAWASERDPRVLPIGRFLRRTRIDELPQLWNVVRGEMSLVGPRPERAVFADALKERYPLFALRETVKPGLTGWAQLRYGYGATMEEQARKLEYDLYYIKNLSLFLDLVCLFHTAKTVISGRGAR
jgi:sugar transferase (PEP-CTERM system associated)